MEPISVIVGISTIGYLIDQYKNMKNFNNKQLDSIPNKNINPIANQYPWNYIENFEETNNETNNETNKEISPLNPEPIISPNKINALKMQEIHL